MQADLASSLYNTIREEYTVRHYYQDRKLMPKFMHSSMCYTQRLYNTLPHTQQQILHSDKVQYALIPKLFLVHSSSIYLYWENRYIWCLWIFMNKHYPVTLISFPERYIQWLLNIHLHAKQTATTAVEGLREGLSEAPVLVLWTCSGSWRATCVWL